MSPRWHDTTTEQEQVLGLMQHGAAKDGQGFLETEPGTVTSAKGYAASSLLFDPT